MRPIARILTSLLMPTAFLAAGPLPPSTPPPDAAAQSAAGDVIAPEFVVDPMADGLYSTYLRLHERLKENLSRSARNESLLRTLAAREKSGLDQTVARQAPPSTDPAKIPPMDSETDATVFWTTVGNVAPRNRPLYLGTLDRNPLSLGANGRVALRIQGPAESPNLLGGHAANFVLPGVVGGTLGGGGSALSPNSLRADYGVVGGGLHNQAGGTARYLDSRFATVGGGTGNRAEGINSTIGGGSGNVTRSRSSVIGGGQENIAPFDFSTVSGGLRNMAGAIHASIGGGNTNVVSGRAGTVAGGEHNRATAAGASIGGGLHNTASGAFSSVPGGNLNLAAGMGSLAAGSMAEARHEGSFVWADRQGISFASTTNHQFLVRAAGNMGLDTATPAEKLTVRGNIAPADTRTHNLGSSGLVWNRLYLHEGIATPHGFAVSRDGQTLLALSPSGDLRIPGKLIAAGVENPHGEALGTGIATAPALPDFLEPARIRGGALTEATVFGGHIAGTRGALRLQPASVEADSLAPEAVHGGHLRANTITSRHILDGSLRFEDFDPSGFDQRYLLLEGGTLRGRLVTATDGFQVGERQLIARGGRIGIGTLQPEEALSVAGTIHSSTGGFRFPDGSVQEKAWNPQEQLDALAALRGELAEIQGKVQAPTHVPLAALSRSVSNQWQRLEALEQSLRALPAGTAPAVENGALREEIAALRRAIGERTPDPSPELALRLGQAEKNIEDMTPWGRELPLLHERSSAMEKRLAGLQGLSNQVERLLVQASALEARLGVLPDQWRILERRVAGLAERLESPVVPTTPPAPSPEPWSPPPGLLALQDRLPELRAEVAQAMEQQALADAASRQLAAQLAEVQKQLNALPPAPKLAPLEQAAIELRKATEENKTGLAQLHALWEERLDRELSAQALKFEGLDSALSESSGRFAALDRALAELSAAQAEAKAAPATDTSWRAPLETAMADLAALRADVGVLQRPLPDWGPDLSGMSNAMSAVRAEQGKLGDDLRGEWMAALRELASTLEDQAAAMAVLQENVARHPTAWEQAQQGLREELRKDMEAGQARWLPLGDRLSALEARLNAVETLARPGADDSLLEELRGVASEVKSLQGQTSVWKGLAQRVESLHALEGKVNVLREDLTLVAAAIQVMQPLPVMLRDQLQEATNQLHKAILATRLDLEEARKEELVPLRNDVAAQALRWKALEEETQRRARELEHAVGQLAAMRQEAASYADTNAVNVLSASVRGLHASLEAFVKRLDNESAESGARWNELDGRIATRADLQALRQLEEKLQEQQTLLTESEIRQAKDRESALARLNELDARMAKAPGTNDLNALSAALLDLEKARAVSDADRQDLRRQLLALPSPAPLAERLQALADSLDARETVLRGELTQAWNEALDQRMAQAEAALANGLATSRTLGEGQARLLRDTVGALEKLRAEALAERGAGEKEFSALRAQGEALAKAQAELEQGLRAAVSQSSDALRKDLEEARRITEAVRGDLAETRRQVAALEAVGESPALIQLRGTVASMETRFAASVKDQTEALKAVGASFSTRGEVEAALATLRETLGAQSQRIEALGAELVSRQKAWEDEEDKRRADTAARGKRLEDQVTQLRDASLAREAALQNLRAGLQDIAGAWRAPVNDMQNGLRESGEALARSNARLAEMEQRLGQLPPALSEAQVSALIAREALGPGTRFDGDVSGTAGTLRLKPSSVGAAALLPNSVNSEKIVDGSVTLRDLDTLSVDQRYLTREGGEIRGTLSLAPGGTLDLAGTLRILGGEPAEGRILKSKADGTVYWAAPESLGLGLDNQAELLASVGGGMANRALGQASVIAGGFSNLVQEAFATVGGGADNQARGKFSTVPGGVGNRALGAHSFAAGRNAVAEHTGAFVWNDSRNEILRSRLADQVLVQGAGGVDLRTLGGDRAGVVLAPGGFAWQYRLHAAERKDARVVDGEAVLRNLATVPVQMFTSGLEKDGGQHVAPDARAFNQAFGLSNDPYQLNAGDVDGITLAAVQALLQRLNRQQTQIEAQDTEIAAMRVELQRLTRLLNER